MVSIIHFFIKPFFLFLSDCMGLITRPYETVRNISIKKPLISLVYFLLLTWVYLSFATVVKFGLGTGALFLTYSLGRIIYAILVLYFLIIISMYFTGRILGRTGSFISISVTWAYAYLPTLIWFFLTTILYIILPPPRTQSLNGQIFTVLFLFISLGLFFWKIILYYLTLRFCLKLNFWQILRASAVLWPFYILLFILFNRIGVFKIPFV